MVWSNLLKKCINKNFAFCPLKRLWDFGKFTEQWLKVSGLSSSPSVNREIFGTLWNAKYEVFCETSLRLNTVYYFCKKLHLRNFTVFFMHLWLLLSIEASTLNLLGVFLIWLVLNLSKLHHEEQERLLLSSLASLWITWNMITIW